MASGGAGWEGDLRMVRWIRAHPDLESEIDTSSWPATVPAVRLILADGLELPAGLTVVVGENGAPVPGRARLLLPPPARRLTPPGPGSRPG